MGYFLKQEYFIFKILNLNNQKKSWKQWLCKCVYQNYWKSSEKSKQSCEIMKKFPSKLKKLWSVNLKEWNYQIEWKFMFCTENLIKWSTSDETYIVKIWKSENIKLNLKIKWKKFAKSKFIK